MIENNRLRFQEYDQVWAQVQDQVWAQVQDQVWVQVRDQVDEKICGQVRDQFQTTKGNKIDIDMLGAFLTIFLVSGCAFALFALFVIFIM